ncbi:hypothetical protein FOZ63_006058, partial [Perkinsus olseni]
SRSGPTYGVLKRKMMDEGWYIKYMIVHDYIVTGSLATRLPHLTLASSFTNTLSKSDSLSCSQLRVLLGVTSDHDDDDEEEGAAYYVVPWLGITDEQIPIAHAVEYYNVLKLLPTHHHKDAAYALLRKGGIPEARAAEAVKIGYDDDDDDDERAAMAITMKDKIKDITAYITPLLTKLIIPITKHEDGHDGGGGGGLMQQDDKKGDGDHCRFGIRGTGLEFTITHTGPGTGSPGGGNYLSGVYCGQELLHDDNDARRFLMDFFNTSLSYHHRQGPLLDELSTSISSPQSSAPLQCNRASTFLDMMIRQRVPLFYAHPAISSNITGCMLLQQQQPTDDEENESNEDDVEQMVIIVIEFVNDH